MKHVKIEKECIRVSIVFEEGWRDVTTRLVRDGRMIEVFSRAVEINERGKLEEMMERTERILQRMQEYVQPVLFPEVYREEVEALQTGLKLADSWIQDIKNECVDLDDLKGRLQLLFDYLNRQIGFTIEDILNIRLSYVL